MSRKDQYFKQRRSFIIRTCIAIIWGIFICFLIYITEAKAGDAEVSFTMRNDGNYETLVEVGHKFNSGIRPYTSIATGMNDYSNLNWHPSSTIYNTGIEYHYKAAVVTVFHVCIHPIDRFDEVLQYNALKLTLKWGK